MRKFTRETIGCEPLLIHLELNKDGSRIMLKGDIAGAALYLAIAAKLDTGVATLLEHTKSILVDETGELAIIVNFLAPGKPTIP